MTKINKIHFVLFSYPWEILKECELILLQKGYALTQRPNSKILIHHMENDDSNTITKKKQTPNLENQCNILNEAPIYKSNPN